MTPTTETTESVRVDMLVVAVEVVQGGVVALDRRGLGVSHGLEVERNSRTA